MRRAAEYLKALGLLKRAVQPRHLHGGASGAQMQATAGKARTTSQRRFDMQKHAV